MMPAQNRGAGMNVGFPDVCNTPAGPATVPIPYPNLAQNGSATGFSAIVKVNMVNALNLSSSMPTTEGDEAGTAHSTVKGKAQFTSGSPTVFIEKQPAIRLLSTSTGNQGNCASAAAVVPSSVNVLFNDARRRGEDLSPGSHDPYARRIAVSDLVELGDVATRTRAAITVLAAGVVLARVESIGLDAGARLAEAAHEARGLILDLRGCPGGAVDGALDAVSRFVRAGTVLGVLVDEDGDELVRTAAIDGNLRVPMVVLVDRATASAAEVLAAGLGAGRAPLVGARTAGKGLAQAVRTPEVPAAATLSSCAALRAPSGASLEGVGVSPHLEAPSPTDASGDSALLTAWAMVVGLLATPPAT